MFSSLLLFREFRHSLLLPAVGVIIVLLFWLGGGNQSKNFFNGVLHHHHDPIRTSSKDIQPTPYPLSFRIHFDTNITRENEISTATTIPTTKQLLHSKLYYDWTIPAQRIDHPAGAYECVRFYNVTEYGCQLYFLKEGMYRLINKDNNDDGRTEQDVTGTIKDSFQSCCLDIPNLGPPPPNWAQDANPTFSGLKHDTYSGYDSYEFVFDNLVPPNKNHQGSLLEFHHRSLQLFGTQVQNTKKTFRGKNRLNDIYDEYHTAREVHDGNPLRNGIPLVFTFPSKAKGLQDYHFDPASLIIGSQATEYFQLPNGCENVACSRSTAVSIE